MATHGVLSGPAIDRIKNSAITKVVVTNTLPLPAREADRQDRGPVGAPGSLAEAIDAVFEDKCVSEIFDGDNQN